MQVRFALLFLIVGVLFYCTNAKVFSKESGSSNRGKLWRQFQWRMEP